MRYQVMTDKYSGGEMTRFFECDDLQEAKDFAIRMCFFNECKVSVFDERSASSSGTLTIPNTGKKEKTGR